MAPHIDPALLPRGWQIEPLRGYTAEKIIRVGYHLTVRVAIAERNGKFSASAALKRYINRFTTDHCLATRERGPLDTQQEAVNMAVAFGEELVAIGATMKPLEKSQ